MNSFFTRGLLVVALAAAAAGCSEDEPTLGDLTDDELAARVIGVADGFGEAIATHQGDCAAMAAGLEAVLDENQDLVEWRAGAVDRDPARLDAIRALIRPRLEGTFDRYRLMLTECRETEAFQGVLARLPARPGA